MADLDDFFAKKDRKKSKGKKFATTEELAKKLEDTSKKTDVKPRPRTIPVNNETEEVINQEQTTTPNAPPESKHHHKKINEDEWKEFEEDEGQKDYSNLKIGQLTISEEEQNQTNMGNDMEGGSDGGSDGEGGYSENSDRRPSGPWKKVTATDVPPVEPQTPQQPPKSNVYVSPALRNQSALGRSAKLKNRVAPDLSNEEYFPTLGTATKQELIAKKKIDANFEEVKHGGRAQKTSDLPSNAPVSVGNRFGSLAD